MIGSRLYKSFGENQIEKHRKGRSKNLIENRNKAICYRYYFYKNYTKISFENLMILLSIDFFISPVTVGDLISKSSNFLLSIKKDKPSLNELKKLYPSFNWDLKAIKLIN